MGVADREDYRLARRKFLRLLPVALCGAVGVEQRLPYEKRINPQKWVAFAADADGQLPSWYLELANAGGRDVGNAHILRLLLKNYPEQSGDPY